MIKNHITTKPQTLGLILAIASVICFTATSLLLSKINTDHQIDGWVAAAYRAVVGLLLILCTQSTTGKLRISHIFTNRILFLRGLIGGATIPVYYICIMQLGPGKAGIIGGTYPLFAAIFAIFLLKESLSRTYFVFISIALLGLIAIFADTGIKSSNAVYDVCAIIGAAAAGLCVVMIRHLRHTETTSNIFASQCLFTLIITIGVAGDQVFIRDPLAFVLTLIAAMAVAGGQLCITESFRYLNVAQGSSMQMLTPVMTVITSALFLGEQFTTLELTGGAMIIYASYKIVALKN